MKDDRRSEDDVQESIDKLKSSTSHITSIPHIVKNGVNIGKRIGPFVKKGVVMGARLVAPIASSASFWIAIGILVLTLMFFMFPASMFDVGEGNNKGFLNQNMVQDSLKLAEKATKEAIHEPYTKTKEEANKKLQDYVNTYYPNDTSTISTVLFFDDENTIAKNISPYILSVNGQIQYWVKDSGIGKDFTKEKDTEYTAFSKEYKKEINDYAKDKLFTIQPNILDEVVEKTIIELLYDENGDPVLDAEGNQMYQEKKIHEGTVYLSVTYSVLEYKEDDIDEASENYYKELKADKDYDPITKEECKTIMRTGIMDMLEIMTGSRSSVAFGDLTDYIGVDNNGFSGDLGILSEYPEMSGYSNYSRNSPVGQAIWGSVHAGSAVGHYSMYDGYQCTDFVHWIFYETYGFDCGYGHGFQMAASTVNKYPDKFALSTSPAPGAIVSSRNVNHVLFVLKCDSENIWFCDGNVSGGGVRINAKWSIAEFNAKYNPIYAVPI